LIRHDVPLCNFLLERFAHMAPNTALLCIERKKTAVGASKWFDARYTIQLTNPVAELNGEKGTLVVVPHLHCLL